MSKITNFLLGILLVAGVLFVGRGLYLVWLHAGPTTQENAELKKIDAFDKEVLEKGTADQKFILSSLERYTNQAGSEGIPFIKKYLNDERPAVVAGALDAAGAYTEPEFFNVIKEKLFSSDSVVRMGALSGLGRRSEKERVELMQQYWLKVQPDTNESLTAKMTDLKLRQVESERNDIKKEILAQMNEAHPVVQNHILEDLFKQMPGDVELIEKAHILLSAAPEDYEPVMPRVLMFLRSSDELWLRLNIAKLPLHKTYEYQLALLDYLSAECPVGWANVLNELEHSHDKQVSADEIAKAAVSTKCKH